MECSVSRSSSAYLDVLYEEYDRFDIQQTTVGVDREEYDVVDKRPDGVAVRVRVEGDDGMIVLPDGDDWVLPGGVLNADPTREAVADLVERRTGIGCSIDGLDRVSLVCLQCDSAPGELWTVSTVFSATATGGSPRNGAVWQDRPDTTPVPSL